MAVSKATVMNMVDKASKAWFKYFQDVFSYAKNANVKALAVKNALAAESANLTTARANLDFLKGQLKEAQDQIFEARYNEQKALNIFLSTIPIIPPVPSATVSSEPTLTSPGSTIGEDTLTTTEPAHSTCLSQRLPDPDRFQGDQRDLRRFCSQIREKMEINHDRFPTPQCRMSYVNSCLGRKPYEYMLPHIKEGECQLSDYEDILKILEDAYEGPRHCTHVRTKLFRLRQTNKDFTTFLAEFQRLAVEGEMPESLLPILLEHAISEELRTMLLHNEPPSYNYHEFTAFLHKLESRRLWFNSSQTPVTVPMNPSNQHRTTRREKGECYRCGSKNHLVARCPRPDTRQLRPAALSRSRPAL
ncbi:hypothetical protein HOO65_100099 [Ceratocystis lukuohia]|uniref:CCHC-type domain-containing protein n=1 Tax=Ceratocystis lukuohia TaxID=2019550 RepID=A0ABR4M8T9_9PEZI